MRRYFLFALLITLVGCTMGLKKYPTGAIDPVLKKDQEGDVKAAMEIFEKGDYAAAEKRFQAFVNENPVSIYSVQARYGLARSIEEQGRSSEALGIYKDLAERARETAPDIAGLAYFRMSYCYEALGDEIRISSTLADATRFEKSLSKEVTEIEIPVRKAASWMRRGDFQQAKAELARVDRAFPGIFPPNDAKTIKDQARILLSAGDMSLEPLNDTNFLSLIGTHEQLQNYLWRAQQTHVDPYAEKARKKLVERYGTFMAKAMSLTDPSKRRQDELRRTWMAAVLKALQELRTFAGDEWENRPADLAASLATVESQANGTLWSLKDTTPLTPEAKSRSSKRSGRVVSKPFFPNEKAADKAKPEKHEEVTE